LNHAPSPLCFGYFFKVSLYVSVSLDQDPSIYASLVTGMTGARHCAQLLLIKMGFSELFVQGWPYTTLLPISAFQVARIIGLSPVSSL
jgi:hypothetical protein